MNSTAVDLEICPGLESLIAQRAACGRSRRSIENSRKRKRLGRAIRKALAPITKQNRRLVATWTAADEIDFAAEYRDECFGILGVPIILGSDVRAISGAIANAVELAEQRIARFREELANLTPSAATPPPRTVPRPPAAPEGT